MANFPICFPFTLENEAGTPPSYIPNADEPPGSEALAGINSHFYPSWFSMIAAAPIEERPAMVENFYLKNFWNQWLEQIASNTLAAMVLDSSVNQGPGTACKILQTAVNQVYDGVTEDLLEIDGAWGPKTIWGVNICEPEALVPNWIQVRVAKYNEKQRDPRTQAALLTRARKIPNF